jgi:hypothetical protein
MRPGNHRKNIRHREPRSSVEIQAKAAKAPQ